MILWILPGCIKSKERDLEIEEVEVWRFAQEIVILIETRIKAAKSVDSSPNEGAKFRITLPRKPFAHR